MQYIVTEKVYHENMKAPQPGDKIWLTYKNKKNKIWCELCSIQDYTKKRYKLHLRRLTPKEYHNHLEYLKTKTDGTTTPD